MGLDVLMTVSILATNILKCGEKRFAHRTAANDFGMLLRILVKTVLASSPVVLVYDKNCTILSPTGLNRAGTSRRFCPTTVVDIPF